MHKNLILTLFWCNTGYFYILDIIKNCGCFDDNNHDKIHTITQAYYIHIHTYIHCIYMYVWSTLNQSLYRPIAGSVNLCPNAVQGSDMERVIATVKHELLHAMVCN